MENNSKISSQFLTKRKSKAHVIFDQEESVIESTQKLENQYHQQQNRANTHSPSCPS
jgi:hypothetical protein